MHVYFGRGGKAVLKMTPLLRGLDSEDLGPSKYPKGGASMKTSHDVFRNERIAEFSVEDFSKVVLLGFIQYPYKGFLTGH